MTRASLIAVLGTAAVACGGAASKVPDVAAYQALAQKVSSAVDNHRMVSTTLSPPDCPAEKSRYEAELRPMLDRMLEMSGDIDGCMSGMGHAGSADMHSTCQSMGTELDDHLAAACGSSGIPAEATRHAAAMNKSLQHEMSATGGMQGMMGGSMMSGGSCHR